MSAAIEFDQASHSYRVGGAPVPSVTTILRGALQFAGVPEDVMTAALQRGTAVHKAVELDSLGTLDEDTVDPRVAPYLKRWREFVAATGYRSLAAELPCASARFGYAGTLDQLGEFRGRADRTVLLDVKTSVALPPSVGPQTAAYASAVVESYGPGTDAAFRLPNRKIDRYVLLLGALRYKLVPLDDPADIAVFCSAVTLWRWCRANRIA